MDISFHGHSIVKVKTNGSTILIDPFIRGNGQTDLKVEDEKPDVILLTHGHNDHLGDTVEIAKACDALVVGSHELANYLAWQGVNTFGMNLGGSHQFDFGKVKFTQAYHSNSYITENNEIIYMGMPAGILLTVGDVTIYHAGDTGLFGDMKFIGERNQIDVAFLPIGDTFTMGPEDAAYAVSLLNPKVVVPIHYNTFPPIQQDPYEFEALVKGAEVQVLQAGQSVVL